MHSSSHSFYLWFEPRFFSISEYRNSGRWDARSDTGGRLMVSCGESTLGGSRRCGISFAGGYYPAGAICGATR